MKKIRFEKRDIWLIPFLIFASILIYITSCSQLPLKTQISAMYLTKATAESIKATAIELHNDNIITDRQYNKIKTLYNRSRELNNQIIDLMIADIDAGISTSKDEKYLKMVKEFNQVTALFTQMAIELKLVKPEDLLMMKGGITQ